MKKFLFTIILLLLAFSANAQTSYYYDYERGYCADTLLRDKACNCYIQFYSDKCVFYEIRASGKLYKKDEYTYIGSDNGCYVYRFCFASDCCYFIKVKTDYSLVNRIARIGNTGEVVRIYKRVSAPSVKKDPDLL